MSKEILWDVFSPDGFSIEQGVLYNTQEEAFNAFQRWLRNFKQQGYYSSPTLGNIPLFEVEHYIYYRKYVKEIKKGIRELPE